jgi:hypothetical protein
LEKISKNIPSFKDFEKSIFAVMCQAGQQIMCEYLKICDRIILAERDTKEYRVIKFGTTTIKTLMGEVTYTRRYYKKRSGGYEYLLDEAMGINNGCGLVSENLVGQIITECTEKSYRKAAASISGITGQGISAMGAWGVLQRFNRKLEKQEERLNELDKNGITGQLGNLPSKVLFEEMDDVWLSMQKETRRKKDEPVAAEEKKTGKKPIHIGIAYTGWKQADNGKYNTIDKFAYAGFGGTDKFASIFEMLLRHRFDMDGIEQCVMNGDGASWIKSAAEESGVILQLDPFHRSRAVMRGVCDKNARSAIFDALKEKDVDKATTLIANLIAEATDEPTRDKLEKLYSYFYGNKVSLLTWHERGLELPEPPEGVVYRNLGVQESSNCDFITQRMKHRKGSWSIIGGGYMAKTLCFRNTIGIDIMRGILPDMATVVNHTGTLSASKAPIYDGKGYDAAWLHADMPFEHTFMTNGREAIKNLLRQRVVR